ncbi:MAG: phosphomannomutase/phosphoglucomutase [Oscillospiraceae bacterium]|jgi:phosphomannomutase|nr:phosphomannomutase/phosphoglucomutase [Oscillospiraceae bacterium]
MQPNWQQLKNGSDIRAVAVAEGDAPAPLNAAVGRQVGAAFAQWLSARLQKPAEALTVAVGRDSRVTGEALAAAIGEGLASQGAKVLACGLCTTPAMFMTTVLLKTDGAVMTTASHLPWQRNGYKFFTPAGGLNGLDISAILSMAVEMTISQPGQPARAVDFLTMYKAHLADLVRRHLPGAQPLAGLHVVVDAGNGAGGFYADLLSELGASVAGSQLLEPDGHFPGHLPNPEAPEAMDALSDAVRRAGADLGVIFDADCDRAALADAEGNEINRNRLIALTGAMLLRETPGAVIVSDSVVSAGLSRFIAARGGALYRFKRGYRNVIDEAMRLNAEGIDCPLAIETSGHAALRENYFLDDGMYLATRLIIEAMRLKRAGESLTALLDGLPEAKEAAEIRMPIKAQDFRPIGEAALLRVTEALGTAPGWRIDADNREGVRLCHGTDDTWCLLRLSLHDPLLVLNAESDRPGGVAAMLCELIAPLATQPAIDLNALTPRISGIKEDTP